MKRQKYFKVYVDSMYDIKFKKLKLKKTADFSHYWLLWSLILNEAAKEGGLVKCTEDDWELLFNLVSKQVGQKTVEQMIYDMRDVGLLEVDMFSVIVKNWKRYQFPAPPAKADEDLEKKIDDVILAFNEITGSRYSKKTEGNRELIRGRLKEGRSVEELVAVIKDKFKKWGSDHKMKLYVRPSTLFRPTNFDNYLNEIPKDIVDAATSGTLLHVRNMYGVEKDITQEEYDKASPGFYTILN